MSALEAMACGKPLVVTNAGGLGHLVPDQGSLKVAPGEAPALATALLRLLQEPELQHKMGRFNRSYVMAKHSWDRRHFSKQKTFMLSWFVAHPDIFLAALKIGKRSRHENGG